MPRHLRLHAEGLLYHVMACGNDGQKIFLGETDYQAFNSRATRTFYVNRKICEIVLDDPKLQGLEDEDFFGGENVRQFSGFKRAAERKLVMLDSTVKLGDLAASPGIVGKLSGNRAGHTVSGSTTMADLLYLERRRRSA